LSAPTDNQIYERERERPERERPERERGREGGREGERETRGGGVKNGKRYGFLGVAHRAGVRPDDLLRVKLFGRLADQGVLLLLFGYVRIVEEDQVVEILKRVGGPELVHLPAVVARMVSGW